MVHHAEERVIEIVLYHALDLVIIAQSPRPAGTPYGKGDLDS